MPSPPHAPSAPKRGCTPHQQHPRQHQDRRPPRQSQSPGVGAASGTTPRTPPGSHHHPPSPQVTSRPECRASTRPRHHHTGVRSSCHRHRDEQVESVALPRASRRASYRALEIRDVRSDVLKPSPHQHTIADQEPDRSTRRPAFGTPRRAPWSVRPYADQFAPRVARAPRGREPAGLWLGPRGARCRVLLSQCHNASATPSPLTASDDSRRRRRPLGPLRSDGTPSGPGHRVRCST